MRLKTQHVDAAFALPMNNMPDAIWNIDGERESYHPSKGVSSSYPQIRTPRRGPDCAEESDLIASPQEFFNRLSLAFFVFALR